MRGLLAGLLVGLVWTAAARSQPPDAAGQTYRLGAKDLIEVRVFEESSLNVERRVADNGSLNLPLLGDFPVAGLTEEQVAGRLKEALERDYLQRATVTVRVLEFRSRPISVLGAVNKPGNLELGGKWTLLEALTDAGGLATDHGQVVHVLRRAENGLSDQLEIRLDDLLMRADPRVNVPLFANDVVTVPAAESRTIYLMGEIQRVGAVTFQSNDRVTLLAAIAQAGGLTTRASSRVSIKRLQEDGTRREIVVNYKRLLAGKEPDLELRDGDLIYVKESFF